ncbi:MAG: hypothetical protein OXG24_01145 [Gammaproteobacteria bacterium]|nr:hypothetical protein [Gammaproteobacteria bacterium]
MKSALDPVSYIEKTKRYYEAQGFAVPYRWARNEESPIVEMSRPLSKSTIGIASTASTYPRRMVEPRSVEAISNDKVPERLYAEDLAWDRKATHLNDRGTFFPIDVLWKLTNSQFIGDVSKRSYFLPTEYSQRKTLQVDAPQVLDRCREDDVEALLLVPL